MSSPAASEAISVGVRERLIRGGSWATLTKGLGMFSGLALNALLARLLSPEELGAYFLALSLSSIGGMAVLQGLNQTVVRLIAESMGTGRPGRAVSVIALATRMVLAGALVVGLLVAFAGGQLATALFDSPSLAGVMALVAGWTVVTAFQSLYGEFFRGFHDIRLADLFSGLLPTVIAVVALGVAKAAMGSASLAQVLAVLIGCGLASNAAAALLLRRTMPIEAPRDSMRPRAMYAIAMPILATNITLLALSQFPIWIIGALRSQEDVALFGASFRLMAQLEKPLVIVNAFLPPLIAEMHAKGERRELQRVAGSMAALAAIPALGLMLVFMVFGGEVLGLVFGDYYSQGWPVLAVLCLGQIVNVLSGSCGMTLMMTGHQGTMLRITLLCGTLAVGGSFLLVERHGALGVAWAATVGLILQNALMLLAARRLGGIWTSADFRGLLGALQTLRAKVTR